MRQARRKMNPVDPFVAGRKDCDSRPMSSRADLLLVCLSGLACAGPAVAAETFGLEGGQAALEAWAQVDARNPLAWFVQGRALGELGRFDEAIAAYRHNLSLAPGDVLARNNLGNAWRDSGHAHETKQTKHATEEIDPD